MAEWLKRAVGGAGIVAMRARLIHDRAVGLDDRSSAA